MNKVYLLINIIGLLLISSTYADSAQQQLCNTNVAIANNTITQALAGEDTPVLSYECIKGGKFIEISFGAIELEIIDTNLAANTTFLILVADDILTTLRGTFLGLTDGGDMPTTNRHTKDNKFIDSSSVKSLKFKKRFSFSSLVPGLTVNDTIKARISSPLAFLQITKKYLLGIATLSGWNTLIPIDVTKNGFLVNLHRSNFTVNWVQYYSNVSTASKRKLAEMYPHLYNSTKVNAWTRDVVNTPGGSFAPFVVTDDGLVITGDNNPTYELLKPNYYAGIPDPNDPDITGFPQANGGPIIKEDWGLYSNYKQLMHYTRGDTFILDLDTGKLLGTDHITDRLEGNRADARTPTQFSAQGFFNPWNGIRQPSVFTRQGKRYVAYPITMLDDVNAEAWLSTIADADQVATAVKNGNIERHYGGVKLYELIRNISGVYLKPVYWWYTSDRVLFGPTPSYPGDPRPVFAGDVNPFNSSERFTNDTRAQEYNYYVDGCWAQGIFYDAVRDILIFGCGNGKKQPVEETFAGWNAIATFNPVTGGQGNPKLPFYDNKILCRDANTVKKFEQWDANYDQTSKDRLAAIFAISPRAKSFLAGTVTAKRLGDGSTAWNDHEDAFNDWQTYNFQEAYLTPDQYPYVNRVGYVSEGGDNDIGIGPLFYSGKTTSDDDSIIVINKNGAIKAINPVTGQRRWRVRASPSTVGGSANYGATIVGDDLFLTLNINDYVGAAWGPLYFRSYINSSNQVVIEYPDATTDSILAIPLPTDVLLDGGSKKALVNAKSLMLVRVDLKKGKITGIRTLNKPEEAQENLYTPFATNIYSINDVVFVPGGYSSKVYAIDARTMEIRWEYNFFEDLKNNTPGLDPTQTFLYMTSAPGGAGVSIYVPAGEVGFQGWSNPGRYLLEFQITDP